MSFAAPVWLLIGAVCVALATVALRSADRRRARDLEQFATRNILPELTESLSSTRRRSKRWLLVGATALGFVALAGPEVGFDWEETQRRGIDVLIAVDVSRSMLARDIQPDRLRRAKLAVDDLVERLGGDRLGLIAFAGTAFLQCPLTLDHAAFDRSLSALAPGIISAPGSNLASALDVARKALESEGKNVKLLILFSDGEDLRGGALAAAERAAEDGIHVFTVGVGTPAGELIPIPGDAAGAFVKDESGRIVKSRLDEATLKKVAEITEGFYVPLGARAEGIDELVERALAPIPREELASRLRRIPRNRYQWPLALALLLLAIEPFVGERRRMPAAPSPGALAAVLVLLLGLPARALAASADDAAQLYTDESYSEAATQFRELAEEQDDPRLDSNFGSAAYRAGEFSDASGAFARALRSEDEALRERAFYDLGNAQYRVGETTVEENPQETMQAWEQAIAAYEEALTLDETDEDARFNRDFVTRKLEELKQEQEEQEQDDEQEKDDQEDQQDQEDENEDQESEQDQQKDDSSGDQQQDPKDDQDQQKEPPPEEEKDDEKEQDGDQDPKDDEPEESPPDDGDEPDDSPPDEGSPEPGEDERRPGQLSPEEARDLLDSLQGEEEFMPMVPAAPADSSEDPRDW